MEQTKKTAWVVDDDPVYRKFISAYLKAHGYTVAAFKSGEACIERLVDNPSVIVLDYYLGDGLNGMDVLTNIKAYNASLPVIFVSSLRDVKIAVSVVKAGCADFIEKDKRVLARLRKALQTIVPDQQHQLSATVRA